MHWRLISAANCPPYEIQYFFLANKRFPSTFQVSLSAISLFFKQLLHQSNEHSSFYSIIVSESYKANICCDQTFLFWFLENVLARREENIPSLSLSSLFFSLAHVLKYPVACTSFLGSRENLQQSVIRAFVA
jgi:hypothetical protein